MDRSSDYLTLWTHYESRGSDDKNRMIATASLLISFSGALLGASIGSLVAGPPRPGTAAWLAVLSGLTALVSAALIKVFEIHAGRNFDAAGTVRGKLDDGIKEVLAKLRPADGPRDVSMLNFGDWLAQTPRGSTTGRIFGFFSAISLSVAVISLLVAVLSMLVMAMTFNWATVGAW